MTHVKEIGGPLLCRPQDVEQPSIKKRPSTKCTRGRNRSHDRLGPDVISSRRRTRRPEDSSHPFRKNSIVDENEANGRDENILREGENLGAEGDTGVQPPHVIGEVSCEKVEPSGPRPEDDTSSRHEEDGVGAPQRLPRSPSPSPVRVDPYSPERESTSGYAYDDAWEQPSSLNPEVRRTLKIQYWDRTQECKERKWDHMDHIDAMYSSREDWIMASVLAVEDIVLEPNMFPYDTPSGIEHWTLWSKKDMTLEEMEVYVMEWIKKQRPEVRRWNVDENAERSIDIFHVHVYFQVVEDEEVGRKRSKRAMEEEEEEEEDRGAEEEEDEEERVSKKRRLEEDQA